MVKLHHWKRRIPREPLVQLLIVGALIFGIDHFVNPTEDPTQIKVEEANLIQFLEYRHRAFDKERFRERLNALSAEELKDLVNEYVTEEALVRKARTLGLDRNDYVARRRLVTQMEYLIDANATRARSTMAPGEVQNYYENNKDVIIEPRKIDFRHIYLKNDTRHSAQSLLIKLRSGTNWKTLGDRFTYDREWQNADERRISQTFGSEFAKALATLKPGEWQGPLTSEWGNHLVFLERMTPGRVPPLAQVESVIRDRIASERVKALSKQEILAIVREYDVSYDKSIAARIRLN